MVFAGLQDDYKRMFRLGIKTNEVDLIVAAVCIVMKLDRYQIFSQSRKKGYPTARFICYHLIRETTDMTLAEIGDLFGGRHHSTVLHGINTFHDLHKVDKGFRRTVYEVKRML